MKKLFKSCFLLLSAILVSCLVLTIGTLYSMFYSIWLTFTLKKWYAFFLFWWRLIDGWADAIGNLVYEIAYALDLMWNVNGEILEDMVTTKEDTTFSQKDISVSASIGKLQTDGDLTKFGLVFSKLLSFAFNQKQHALDAWNYTQAKKILKDKYFKRR